MRLISRALVASALVLGSSAAVLSTPAGAAPGHRHDDDRLRAAVTRHTPDYDFELILTDHPTEDPGSPLTWVRRTDDVGSSGTEPDAHGFVQNSSWNARSGRNCVTSSGGEFYFDDAPTHAFTYGIAGRNVSRVTVVLEDGTRLNTTVSRTRVDGFGGYAVERPLVPVDHINGYDRHGHKVSTFVVEDPFGKTSDFAQDDASTCVPYPF